MDASAISLKGGVDMEVPVMIRFIKNLLEDVEQSFVGCLSLADTLWVIWRGPMVLNMKYGTKITHMLDLKRDHIASNDGGGHSIAAKDVIKDKFGLLDTNGKGERDSFDPLGELFNICNDKLLLI